MATTLDKATARKVREQGRWMTREANRLATLLVGLEGNPLLPRSTDRAMVQARKHAKAMAHVGFALSKVAPESVNVLTMVLEEAREDAMREATEREEAEEAAERLEAVIRDLATLEAEWRI